MVLYALMYLLPRATFEPACLLSSYSHQFPAGADFQCCPTRHFHFLSHWEVCLSDCYLIALLQWLKSAGDVMTLLCYF